MADKSLRRTLVGVAVAAALGVIGGAADARSYSVPFDPYEFAGVGLFSIDDACLTQGNGLIANNPNNVNDSDPYCGISLDNLVVSLYDANDFAHTDLLGTLTFNATISRILGVAVQGGVPVGILSDILDNTFSPQFAGTPGSNPPPGPFWAEFLPPAQFLIQQTNTNAPLVDQVDFGLVNLYEGTCNTNSEICSPDLQRPNVASVISITAVPEPGTLGLLLGALGGGWLARRRKQPAD